MDESRVSLDLRLPRSLREATEREILDYAYTLPGSKLIDIAPWLGSRGTTPASRRGDVGAHVERAFGLSASSEAGPDFPIARIELKTVPLAMSGRAWRPKERTTISMINYVALAKEPGWALATVRKKLERVLFIFFEWERNKPLAELLVRDVFLWVPDSRELEYLRADWEAIRSKVTLGEAHLLSDSDTRVLAATTKARDSRQLREQVPPGPRAKPRAFTLKRSFMTKLFADITPLRVRRESLMSNLRISRVQEFEHRIEKRAGSYAGRSLGELGAALGVPGPASKNYAARVVRRMLGARDPSAGLREFEEFGIEIKIVPMPGTGGPPYESTSFPAFRYADLIEEEWEGADLRERLGRLLFVPVIAARRGVPQSQRLLGRAFFWTPSLRDWQTVEREWTMFRDQIAAGKAVQLPTAAATQIIHVRPHARNAADTDVAPRVGRVVKKSFWLNSAFVQRVVEANDGRAVVRQGR